MLPGRRGEWRWLIILKLPQLYQFSNIYFSPVPGIFLILGKLINKLKHHLRPRQSVLYDQVVANRNKTVLRHEEASTSEYREPLQPIGSHPSKPRSDEYQTVERKNGEEFKILG